MGAIYLGSFTGPNSDLTSWELPHPSNSESMKRLIFLFLVLDLHEGEASPVAAAGK